MHPDLELLLGVGDHDHERRQQENQRDSAARRAAEARDARDQLRQQIEALDQQIREAKEAEHALSRKLHLYRQRRESAVRVLEGGGGNPMAAERQLAQCDDIIDETETSSLEVMEQLDALAEARTARAAELEAQQTAVADAEAEAARVATRVEGELDRIASARKGLFDQLSSDLQHRYDNLARRKGSAVATVNGDACSKCRIVVHQQQIANIKRGLIETCRGCGRWLAIPETD